MTDAIEVENSNKQPSVSLVKEIVLSMFEEKKKKKALEVKQMI